MAAIHAVGALLLAGADATFGVPAPPDTDGSVGPNHVMSVHNAEVRITDRNGTELSRMSHVEFWADATNGVTFIPIVGTAHDPRVLYDPYDERWIVTASADRFSTNSSLLVAVSRSNDPTGVWNRYQFPASTNDQYSIDYPNVGFNTNWVAVHCNVRNMTNYTEATGRLYVFDKQSLYADGPVAPTQFELSGEELTMSPATTYDPEEQALYLVHFVPAQIMPRISRITGPVGLETLTLNVATATVSDTWSALPPSYTGFAPQADVTNTVNSVGERIWSTVFRNGSIWFAHTMYLPTLLPQRSSVQWWEVSPGGQVQQRGRIDDPNGVTFYATPSLTVNKANDVLIGFSAFSPTMYPSAGYAFHPGQAEPGLTQAPYLFKPGEGPYYRPGPGGFNMWGDHSSSSVDPVDDTALWTIQEYAAGPSNLWATWWARVDPPPYADLALALTAGTTAVQAGESVHYSMVVTNVGATTATSARIESPLSFLLSSISATSSLGTCYVSNDTLVCDLGTLPSGGSAAFTYSGIASNAGVITNRAYAFSYETDTFPTDNAVTSTTCVAFDVLPELWINELHYHDDTLLIDLDQGVEVAGPAGTDLSSLRLVLYDGSSGTPYAESQLSGSVDDEGAGYGARWFPFGNLDNGTTPLLSYYGDGVALVGPCDQVLQFISYEGVITAASGPAAGLSSVDIGVTESENTPTGSSLQLLGTGLQSAQFTWYAERPESRGSLNGFQDLAPPVAADLRLATDVFPAEAAPGEAITLVLAITHTGPQDPHPIRTETVLPSSAQVISVLTSNGNCTVNENAIACDLPGPLGIDETAEITIVFSLPDVASVSLVSRVLSPQNDPVLADNTRTNTICVTYPDVPPIWINEFHYEDTNLFDVAEGVEIAGVAGTRLDGLELVFYDGLNQQVYLSSPLSGVIPHERDGFGAVWFPIPFIQNGALIPDLIGQADGIALVLPCGVPIQFISYEGAGFTAANGRAAGSPSQEIGVYEPATTPAGDSLQLGGFGSTADAFTWHGPATASPGLLNNGQTMDPDPDGDGLPSAWEYAFFGDITNAPPQEDSDGDGSTNLDEYVADTDPTDAASYFYITLGLDPTEIGIEFRTSSNRIYDVDYRLPVSSNEWLGVVTDLPGNGSTLSVVDTNAVGPVRWYRGRVKIP